ncbi:MAG: 5-dehydro-4-deoxyglucarate dehydratase [Verrucomicrobia bacterium]|nr:5-dehydro-4-deoxyglucarate dehydratase [Verrucomicrobiota bacterium]
MKRSPHELQYEVGGLLPFVCTPFSPAGAPDLPRLREHLRYLAGGFPDKPSCFFVGCGTGEFWSLELSEYAAVVRAAVETVGRDVPVLAGVGYGTRQAVQFVAAAEAQGADGVLVFPPYLITGPQEGLILHYRAIAESTTLAVMIYQRDNALLEPGTVARLVDACPNIIGVKDGHGDLQALKQMRDLLGEAFLLMNGMPSAEMFAPSYYEAGIRPYSPGVIDFLPEVSWALYHALEVGDAPRLACLTDGFYRPYTELRMQTLGYGVALVKAGLKLRGQPAGGVRPPLIDPSPEHITQLHALIERGLALARDGA